MNDSLSILIIDDDEDDREWLSQAILETGPEFRISDVPSAKDGLALLKQVDGELPDMIFLDMNMPLMNGLQCLEEIRKENRLQNIPVVVYTTSPMFTGIDKIKKFEPVLFLTKPSRFNEIVDAVHDLFTQYFESQH